MKLIYGTLANGTWNGEIPRQKNNTVVHYCASFKDELDYSNIMPGRFYHIDDEYTKANICPKSFNLTDENIPKRMGNG